MCVRDITKLIICVMVVIAGSLLTYYEKIPGEAGVGLITAVLGYVFGNGHGVFEYKNNKIKGGDTNE